MNNIEKELTKELVINNQLGLHARPCAMIAKIAQQAVGTIWLIKEDHKVEAASIIDILTLACAEGDTITLAADNSDDHDRFNEIIDLFEKDFGE